MKRHKMYSAIVILLVFAGTLAFAGAAGAKNKIQIPKDAEWYQWYPAENLSYKNPAEIRAKFQLRGKARGNAHPTEAVFGQIFVDTKDGREWIFDGMQWVPHDDTVDDYYEYLKTVKKFPPNMECSPASPKDDKEGQ